MLIDYFVKIGWLLLKFNENIFVIVVNNRPVSTGSSSSMVKEPVEHGVDYDTGLPFSLSRCQNNFDGI